MKIHRSHTRSLAAIAVAGLALAACGGDDDDDKAGGGGGVDEATAQRVETHLMENVKELPGSSADPGSIVSDVQVAEGKLKIVTFLNADLPADVDATATLCDAAIKSGGEAAQGATVVDAGDVELRRC